jgi:DNA-binding MarR family transcriptional regulator
MMKAMMATRTTAPGVTVLLTRLSRLVYRRTPEEKLGVTLKEFATLAHLREHNPTAQQDLGEMLCIDANNLVLLLNDLEASGYALRRRDPEDRRRHLVEITSEGISALEGAEAAMESVEDDVLGALSPSERTELRKLLAKAFEGAPPSPRS